MTITLIYFGLIAEITESESEVIQFDQSTISVSDMQHYLIQKYPSLQQQSFQIAVNKQLNPSTHIQEGDEVACLPPFAGG